ncbi:DNA topoisomerase IB [Rubrobacter aplysinae]|uniref:DNA topoisomerase IB n=1 Tax=Rubrobacter aplysinae TaxID=909625 RepID=UPI00064B8E78|nr:DNA topoisomerase IB [Rubrobacter aplysinae]
MAQKAQKAGEHVLFRTGIRRLGTKESGFFYRYVQMNETVRDGRTLERIQGLKVPPAWRQARIAKSPGARVQAVGYDTSGRLQYQYSASYREQKEREKFERVLRFADALPGMRQTTSAHLRREGPDREKVLAAMTRLMNVAYFRVGDERYAKNGTYGIATLRERHLTIDGDTIIFEYSGKWGRVRRQAVTDRRLRTVVEECVALPGNEVFKYRTGEGEVRDVKSRDLSAYVKRVVGEEFSPKDFRTWAGTLVAAVKLSELGAAEDEKAAQKNVLAAVDEAAERLGNTRDIARASYVSPRLIDHYLEGSVIARGADRVEEVIAAEQEGLTEEEEALLGLLGGRLRRELEEAA